MCYIGLLFSLMCNHDNGYLTKFFDKQYLMMIDLLRESRYNWTWVYNLI